MIRIAFLLTLQTLSLACICQTNSNYFDKVLKGKYNVGFKRYYHTNNARIFVDTCYSEKNRMARPTIINLWYPTHAGKGKKIKISDLIRFKSDNPTQHRFNDLMTASQYKLSMFYTYADRNGDSFDSSITTWKTDTKTKFLKYYNLTTNALLNAPMANKQFPLVVYHPGLGGTADDSFLFAEYLASHGYVVISGAYQSNDCTDISIGWNLDISLNEIDVLLAFAKEKIPNVDITKVIGAGHSYGAQAMLAYAAISATPVLGFIINDNTADYEETYKLQGFQKLKDRIYPKLKQITKPLFVVARTSATFKIIDSLKYCNRYYLKIPNMDHNDFTSQGAIAKLIEYDISKDFKNLKQPYINYIFQIQASLKFMESVLNKTGFSWTAPVDASNQLIFEFTPTGTSKY